jgi:benzodiazapine receptor
MATSLVSRSLLNQSVGLAGWLLLTFLAAGVGAVASVQAGTFYAQLARPSWAPPGWLFGPVWSALYFLMGVSAWLVWRTASWRSATPALALYIVQLGANALWTWLFFVWHQGAWAFTEVLLLLLLIAVTVAAFRRHSILAAALLLPYLAWVTFAAALTWATWRMNPAVLA